MLWQIDAMTLAGKAIRRKRIARAEPGDLLSWYDRHRRVLPWRVQRGERADPYRVWLSEIMLQQTTVKTVAPYFGRFMSRFPAVHDLAAAPLQAVLQLWAGLGYYARARNLHACAKDVVARHGGRFPENVDDLLTLPGIGAYTAAAIAAIAFDRSAMPVDGNVERVITRLFAIEDELPGAKAKVRERAEGLMPPRRVGDFAQAMMDLGATVCTPKNPACALCPWNEACLALASGDQESFPRKAQKREGKLRRGAAFVAIRADDCVLVRSRPAKGLLGGMTEVPTTDWSAEFDDACSLDHAPRLGSAKVAWRRRPGVVTHVFTHFPLELVVYVGHVPARTKPPAGSRFIAIDELADAALPTVMRKVTAHAGVAPHAFDSVKPIRR
jgi:A/G-specific adenine glycosylase